MKTHLPTPKIQLYPFFVNPRKNEYRSYSSLVLQNLLFLFLEFSHQLNSEKLKF